MTASPAMLAPPSPPATSPFLKALAASNPFSHHRVTAEGPPVVDVPSVHDMEFRRLSSLALQAHAQDEAVGVVLWGESGSGKSNLLRRLEGWADGGRACLVNFLELQAAPDRLARAVLTALVNKLTAGLDANWHTSLLYAMVELVIRPGLPAGKKKFGPQELEEVCRTRFREILGTSSATAKATSALLSRFFVDALDEKSRRKDANRAAAAVRRLAGDALDEDEAKAVGLRSVEVREPLDAAECIQAFAALTRVIHASGRPVVVCFDQINNLPCEQITAVSQVIHEINDRCRNLVIILSEVQNELVKLKEAGIIRQATWDRLSANRIIVPRVFPKAGRQILEARLEEFLKTFEDAPAVSRHFKSDPLFPLGSVWFEDRTGKLVDFRIRHLIDMARVRWVEIQSSLEQSTNSTEWLNAWPKSVGDSPSPPPPPPTEDLIDAAVEKAVTERVAKHKGAPHSLPANADNVCGLTNSLLSECATGLAVERPKRIVGYDLLLRRPEATGDTTYGLVFLSTGSANSVTNTLSRILADKARPHRVVLVTDTRSPLAFGRAPKAQGRLHYTALKNEKWFEHVELTFDEYATLESLDFAARQASDLEIPTTERTRPLTRPEVVESHRRKNRLRSHTLLRRFLLEGTPVAVPSLSDAEMRQFLFGRLGITIGCTTPELTRVFLNELPPDRRTGLDPGVCRTRIEAVARKMAEAKEINMNPLPDGFFLLPLVKSPAK